MRAPLVVCRVRGGTASGIAPSSRLAEDVFPASRYRAMAASSTDARLNAGGTLMMLLIVRPHQRAQRRVLMPSSFRAAAIQSNPIASWMGSGPRSGRLDPTRSLELSPLACVLELVW
jgi:hypothetical protein